MISRLFSKVVGAWRKLDQRRSPAPTLVTSPLGDLLAVPEAWQLREGFHHPEWKKIAALIKERAATEQESEACWHHASLQWVNRLKGEMGSQFRVAGSRHFLLLSAKANTPFRYFLGQCESALMHLRARLGEAAWHWKHGKHVVLMFEDEDAYYRYISHFYPDGGEYGTSSGVCLRGGYRHTALAPNNNALPALVHELTHLCLTGQRLPKWLEEGLATHLERELTGQGARDINKNSIIEQRAFWNGANIQRFWTGESFRVGDERKYSYGLAEHLVVLLSGEFRQLGRFIRAADREDAGQAAASKCLGVDIGDIAAAFLGDGDWHPHPAEPRTKPTPQANATEWHATP